MNTAVYDLLGQKTYSEYSSYQTNTYFSINLPSLLVKPPECDRNNNQGPYLISRDHLVLDHIVRNEQINTENVYSIANAFLGLQFNVIRLNNTFSVMRDYPSNKPEQYEEILEDFFSEYGRLISIEKRKVGITEEPDRTVITVPDWFEDKNQDKLMHAARSSCRSPILLWRSIAAFLGAESKISRHLLADGDWVMIDDATSTTRSLTLLKMHQSGERFIPGHYIFWDTESTKKRIREELYPVMKLKDRYSAWNNEFSLIFQEKNKFLSIYDDSPNANTIKYIPGKIRPKIVITLGDDKCCFSASQNLFDEKNDFISKGAKRFTSLIERGETPYYEECKALYMVIITSEEQVALKTLIPYNETLPAGRPVQQQEITGISLQKGSDSVEFNLLFSSETDENKLKEMPLRTLKQKLNMSDELINHPQEVPLKLKPSVEAGQGQAKVEIIQSDRITKRILNPVNLDWEKMKESGKSVSYIEEHMPRSFPVDIPPVRFDRDKFRNALPGIKTFLTRLGNVDDINLAKSTFVNKDASGIKKLERSSVFGMPTLHQTGLPFDSESKEISIELFHKLRQEYNRTNDSKILRQIAWTYQGKYFEDIKDEVLNEAYSAATMQKGMIQQKITCCANLLTKDSERINFIKVFSARIIEPTSVGNWCRGAYQVLMYSSTFLDPSIEKGLTKRELQICMRRLIIASSANKDKESTQKYIDMCMFFLLKGRRYHPDFCKKTSEDIEDLVLYEGIKCVLLKPKAMYAKSVIDLYFYITEKNIDWKKALPTKLLNLPYYLNDKESFLRNVQSYMPSYAEWNRINNWTAWDDPMQNIIDLSSLSAETQNILRRMKAYERNFNLFNMWLVQFFNKNLQEMAEFESFSKYRASTDWWIELGKMLIGQGSLDFPKGDL